ncbi:protein MICRORCHIDIA 6-like [Malania oleifera]|uniref:protein MICRORCHIDIA 6-like n=1 Tax=Malania oleifera TaxID=397392 RepID=UPI0025AE6C99|nr:protein MICRORCHIDIA 6-like [Malania oleifera]XP_057951222.1 protein MICRORCHIDIA 6-like [Malania oleifera]XP_057951223.1 protein MICRORCHIDIA 6-like [Malania oleifera]XP_057951225.1 protein MICRORCHIDIA 6-like [Malania oleifera]XP_057951226.1 protein MICRORCHIDIA 6-like [Malania oleifera]XP_057951227.1 protein MICRORCHIDIA 6-like [Malania oleifera]XP_057951228.1 protein MICRORCHIDIA 6-like [Malania oleifera]
MRYMDCATNDEPREANIDAVKLEPNCVMGAMQLKKFHRAQIDEHQKSTTNSRRQDSEENRDSNALSTGQSSTGVVDQEQSPMDDASLSSASPICPAPLCRQFWKAGNYDDQLGSRVTFQNGKNYLHIHPKFLHSNATSHKWVFGAIAELLDNAFDEIQNGASFVIVDKITNPRDGNRALLIQDDGGGMGPDAMRHCMSFGFSDKKSKSTIGQYGNGFKTSTMRLGADVVVFSRHLDNRTLNQSIGLLSYNFLTQTGHDRIVVPMVDYEFNMSTGILESSHLFGREHFNFNLSLLLQWSPYSTEAELLKQFDDIGYHGTKIIIYNLWCGDDGNIELDFDSDPEDIRIAGETKNIEARPTSRTENEQHIAHRLHYSLRAYLSILYLQMPKPFRMVLCGRVVEQHNIANDLKYQEFILYKPQSGGTVEGTVVTTIGFLKEAPYVNIHGFNVYHKNRLILPFWQVLSRTNSRGRGVVGVLEANFVEPTHNKQDFERTSLLQKLESRLKEMTLEYWDFHCGLLGYIQAKPRAKESLQGSCYSIPHNGIKNPVTFNQRSLATGNVKADLAFRASQNPAATSSQCIINRAEPLATNFERTSQQGTRMKRMEHVDSIEPRKVKRQAGTGASVMDTRHYQEVQPSNATANQLNVQETTNLMQENKKLRAQCLEYEKNEEELNLKVTWLRSELGKVQLTHAQLLAELQLLDAMKAEKNANE